MLLILAVLAVFPHSELTTSAQAAPCRAGVNGLFRPPYLCAETIIEGLTSQGIASVAGLTFGPKGTLFFARPATGEIIRLDPDAHNFFMPPKVFASNLPEPPVGIAYDPKGDAWYVSGDTTITRLSDPDHDGVAEKHEVIVSGLPGGVGGWLGNIRIGPDRRLYVAKASSCDACIEQDPRRAALLSFAMDGSDMRIVARGLRDSFDFDWNPANGKLYIIDDERPNMPAKLNEVVYPGADFGWPFCDSAGRPVEGIPGADEKHCASTIRPVATFAPGSHPMGVSFYQGPNFPEYQAGLLVALAGSWNTTAITGYELELVRFGPNGDVTEVKRVLPVTPRNTTDAALIRTSFHPYHLAGIAISPESWIYISVSEGRIYRFRIG